MPCRDLAPGAGWGVDDRATTTTALSLPPLLQRSAATVYLHGAHVTSYVPPGGDRDVLFVSREAVFKPPKAIRGGVPLCWPQFGDMGGLPTQHGFARNSAFELEIATESAATLCLKHAGDAAFPHPHELRVAVSLTPAGALQQTVTVKNTGVEPLRATLALHTYIRVADVRTATVKGLASVPYLDSLDGRVRKVDNEAAVSFAGEVDRIYMGAPSSLSVADSSSSSSRTVTIATTGLPDAVVWNPWTAKAAATGDLGDTEWREFVCVEPAAAGSGPVEVAPGGEWVGGQTLSVA